MSGAPDLGPRFTPLRRLASGGAAETWIVDDAHLHTQVAAKVLYAEATQDETTLFRREFEIRSRMEHPAIVPVHDLIHVDGRLFFTMALVDGGDAGRLRGAPADTIVAVTLRLAEALDHAHSLGVVHRDVKTSNVLLDREGLPRLTDFGIAGDQSLAGSTVVGGGSRHSVSPQQLVGDAPDAADDIYGLGTLVYELITGYPPLWPDLTDDRILKTAPEPPESPLPLPPRLTELVMSMLSKDPRRRPASMAVIVRTLVEIEQDLATRRDPTPPRPPGKPIRLTPPPRVNVVHPGDASTVTPPLHRSAEDAPSRRWLQTVVISVLALALITVIFFLPRWVERRPSTESEISQPTPVDRTSEPDLVRTPAGLQDSDQSFRENARRSLDVVLKLDDSLRKSSVELWGGESYASARDRMTSGDNLLKTGRHEEAADEYDRAAEMLRGLEGRAEEVLSEALDDGQKLLEAGDSAGAETAFRLALAIRPNHRRAADGLARAGVLDELLALMVDGEEAYGAGDLSRAEDLFRRAVDLDPRSADARAALARARQRSQLEEFNDAVGEGLAALDRREYEDARRAFVRAGELRPESPESAEGLARAEAGLRSTAIDNHHQSASGAEASEDWPAAVAAYEAVLEIDPTLIFALDGRDRSRARVRLAEQIEYHIAHPERLQAPEVLEQATELLDDAMETRPKGPVLAAQVERLHRVVDMASTPVTVELMSDNMTDVLVYRVGQLGTFSNHTLELRPGTYTIVGARDGYRDVRLVLVVNPGARIKPLSIRCEEEL